MNMGVTGAALSTGIGYVIVAVAGVVYFAVDRKLLYFTKAKMDIRLLIDTCTNGSAEFFSNLATAFTTFLFNFMFLKYFGENGVASITIILYFQYMFTALYTGYSNGVAPIISYKHGENNQKQLRIIFSDSLKLILCSSIIGFLFSKLIIAKALLIFTPLNSEVYLLTISGFQYYSFTFLFMGIGIFASIWFTALSKGTTGAIISLARTFISPIVAIVTLPVFLGAIGVWMAVPFAEMIGIFISIFLLNRHKRLFMFI